MEFSLTQRGNQAVLYKGYEYTKFRENSSGVIHWRCRICFTTKCKAVLKTRGDDIVGEVPKHCHDSNPQMAQVNILMHRMKEDIKADGATPESVMGNNLSNVKMEILEHMPMQSSVVHSLYRHKGKKNIPDLTAPNFTVPEEYVNLILYDTGEDDPDRVLAIGNSDLVAELDKDVIYGDGTFDKSPKMFYQLFTWHAKIGNSYPPCVYFLLRKKTITTFNTMFFILQQLVPNLIPQKILLDLDKACMFAAQIAFPQAEVKGCYFHLCQSVIKKINNVGLKEAYESDIDMRLKLKSLPALAFVPISDVKTIFNDLADTLPDEDNYNEVLSYFFYTFIEGVIGRTSLFPLQMWNHNEVAVDNWLETINCCAGFHNSLNSIFQSSNPTINYLLDVLKRDVAVQQQILVKAHTGCPQVNKKYENLSYQVTLAVQEYHYLDNKLIFLRQMANLQ